MINWSQNGPGGAFVAGNQVAYAVTFTNAAGEESIMGPWSAWTTVPAGYACPEVSNLPLDLTNTGTTTRNVYRMWNRLDQTVGLSGGINEKAISMPVGDADSPQGTLVINFVKCIKTSSGVASVFNTAISGVEIAGGVVVAIGGVVAATGVGAAAGAVVAAVGGTVIALAGATGFIVNAVGKSSTDDIYLKLNGNKIWPAGNYLEIDDNEQEYVNLTFSNVQNNFSLQLMESDLGDDDVLVDFTLDFSTISVGDIIPYANMNFANLNENSIYQIGMTITRTA